MKKIYRIKPAFNGSKNRDYEDFNDALKWFYKCNSTTCGKMYGTKEDKIRELMDIGKLEIIHVP